MGPLFFWSEALGRTEEEQRAAEAAAGMNPKIYAAHERIDPLLL